MPYLFDLPVDPLPGDEHGGGLGVRNLEVNRCQVQLRRSNRGETNYKYKHQNLVGNELQAESREKHISLNTVAYLVKVHFLERPVLSEQLSHRHCNIDGWHL